MPTFLTRENILGVYNLGPEAVVDLVLRLQTQIALLGARVEGLERKLALDSHNSSKPPSTDRHNRRPKPKSLRQRSGRKPGGQPGHQGNTLEMSSSPDQLVVHTPKQCKQCKASLADAAVVGIERRQVIDVPSVLVRVVEHQAEARQCHCGTKSCGRFPDGVSAKVQYGPGLKALAVYFNQTQLIPMERTGEILAEVFGCPSFSQATLDSAVEDCHESLAKAEDLIKKGVQKASLAHFDETGLNVGGKLTWLHVASTQSLTHYGWDAKRVPAGADKVGILPKFKGIGVHDALETYWGYGFMHALCNGHHLRELTYFEEELDQTWAGQMKRLLGEIKERVDEARSKGQAGVSMELQRRFERRYGRIIARGYATNSAPQRPPGTRGRPKRGVVLSFLDRLVNRRDAVLRFMRDLAVPFDNNQAERDIRMMKLKQKISGCFRTTDGAKMFCRIRSYTASARKQAGHVFPWLQSVFLGNPILPVVPAE